MEISTAYKLVTPSCGSVTWRILEELQILPIVVAYERHGTFGGVRDTWNGSVRLETDILIANISYLPCLSALPRKLRMVRNLLQVALSSYPTLSKQGSVANHI
jgi:hypothetical protein